ncbi:MAG: protein-L-isoaspartate O-methyltransferase [Alphaproteobacteria bacterium]|nr:protein-L-isoaspartate O-methyltransferase [Alphaproteobacteria bacterium]
MDFAAARRNMVESQLRTNRITEDSLLSAMGAIPREHFVPDRLADIAYVDEDLEIGEGRYLMEPMVLGRLLQAATPGEDDAALAIGCGTGYSAAVMSHVCGAVLALECDAALAAKATANFARLGADNVVAVEGPLDHGWPDQAPYNIIVFDGGIAEVPPAILDQLAEGGRLLAVIAEENDVGRATLFHKLGGSVSRRILFDAVVPILPGFAKAAGFVF